MSLYLAVFASDADEEIDGADLGGYDDFHAFRSAVQAHLEPKGWGSRFPVLMSHNDGSDEWSVEDAARLERELMVIRQEFQQLPALAINTGWQADVIGTRGLRFRTLHESFFDVDGVPVVDRLIELARLAQHHHRPISFQ